MPFLDDIKDRLVAAGVGVYGTNIFLGSGAVIPPAPATGPFLHIREYGGSAPTRVHNESGAHTQRPTAQIVGIGASYQTTRAMVRAAYVALDGVFNTTISGTFYQSITAKQEPTDLDLEEGTNRRKIGFNIEAEKAPS